MVKMAMLRPMAIDALQLATAGGWQLVPAAHSPVHNKLMLHPSLRLCDLLLCTPVPCSYAHLADAVSIKNRHHALRG